MCRNLAWAYLHLCNLSKCRLQRINEFCLKLWHNFIFLITICYITAKTCIKQKRICNFKRVNSITADLDIFIQINAFIYHTEPDRIRRSEFIICNFFCIHIIYALIFPRITAITESLSDCQKCILDTVT